MNRTPSIAAFMALLGDGVLKPYAKGSGGQWMFEGPRPGAGWHRHDWKPKRIAFLCFSRVVYRRRWRLAGTTRTCLERCPDEVFGSRYSLMVMVARLWLWLISGKGLNIYEEEEPFSGFATRRTVHRWLHRLLPRAMALQQALRTAVIERAEPQPIEKLFPGGLSPPGVIRCRRWKDKEKVYSLWTALSFLFDGTPKLGTTATVLLAEARRRLDGPLNIAAT